LKDVWHEEVGSDDPEARNSPRVQAYISRLRRKIELDPTQPELIINIPRSGYCYMLKS
jgi:DNA-binding response OmpR family regulator